MTWRVRQADGAGRRLALEWVEGVNGQQEERGSAQSGYGRQPIERALPYAPGARTRFEPAATSLRCRIDLPLDKRRVGEAI